MGHRACRQSPLPVFESQADSSGLITERMAARALLLSEEEGVMATP